jgi:hypothetical protein
VKTRPLANALVVGLVCVALGSCSEKSSNGPAPVCSFTVTPASQSFGPDGGQGAVSVTTTAGCGWSASSGSAWISVPGTTLTGTGSVTYTVSANPETETRTGAMTIAGQSHAVTQQGRTPAVCSYELAPDSAEFGSDASGGTFSVTAPADCTWLAVSDASWLVVTAGSQGSGSGTIVYSVARNTDVPDRAASITLADRIFTVGQEGDYDSCQSSVTPVNFETCMPAGTLNIMVSTQNSCPWTATRDASWLDVTAGSAGSGSGAITVEFTENYDARRLGIVMVRWPAPTAGQNVRLDQAGCLYGVSRSAFSFTASAGTGTFDVLQQSDPNLCGGATQDRCVWSAVSDVPWITITSSMPRSGDNPVAFAVAANAGASARVGRITVRDKVVVITQAGQ